MAGKEINILGAGISGLACAIILQKNGYAVNVYEKQKNVGVRFNNDWQGIENWSEDVDVLEQIKSYGIDISFEYESLDILNVHYECKRGHANVKNGVYFVRRGNEEGCLEMCLLDQARKVGVNVCFDCKVSDGDVCVHVNATGPNHVSGLVKGIKFTTKAHDSYHMAFGENIASGFYSYLLIKNGQGTIATVFNRRLSDRADEFLDNTVSLFADYLDRTELLSGNKFGGYGYFEIKKSLHDENGALLVGEAGGFQDYLWGFGMRYAFQTAYFAARSIMNGESYEELVRTNLVKKMKYSARNRFIFELMGKFSYPFVYYLLTKTKHPLRLLKRIY